MIPPLRIRYYLYYTALRTQLYSSVWLDKIVHWVETDLHEPGPKGYALGMKSRTLSLVRRTFPNALGLLILCLISSMFFSCVTTVNPVSGAQKPRTAAEAIGLLTRDLLLSLPVPLRLGIDDFPLSGGRRVSLGRYLTDLFVSALSRQGGGAIAPVERKQLEAALAESEYSLNQVISDPKRFSQVGQFLPAQAIATGSITLLDDHLSLSIRVFSVSSGEILAAGTVEILRDSNIERLVPQI